MDYKVELDFFLNILNKYNLQCFVLTKDISIKSPIDYGIRHFLSRHDEYSYLFQVLPFKARPNTIYKVTDQYLCNYIYCKLPGKEDELIFLGPYLSTQITYPQLLQEAERLKIPPNLFNALVDYYGSIPVLQNESLFFAIMNTLGETLWGSNDLYTVIDILEDDILTNPISIDDVLLSEEKTLLTMEDMEKRYNYENELLKAVSLGMTHKATQMLTAFSELALKQRVSDPLRNMKNYCIIMNTLLRKAAEKGGVHPLYLDKVSSEFARKIELVGSSASIVKMMTELITAYCRLVNKHSFGKYSRPIQTVLISIDSDLSGDLSLHRLAKATNISTGYLCSLFKKELGKTLTEYVNERRLKHAIHLLITSNLQIQTIAQHCGIPDVNYFSKLFKKHHGYTPKEYRKLNYTSQENTR